jgi:predicted DCC family thiol-disulfide oxidoreductase YuxK
MAMMHIGILFFQDILFLDLILLQLIFVDFDQLRPAIANWYASHQKPITIIYDGLAPTCCRNVRVLKFLDIFEQLQFQDFSQLDLDKYNDQHRLNLEEIVLTDRINIISQDHCYRGFSGCKFIVLALPLCWILTPFIFLPGLSFLGEKLYQLSLSNPPSSAKKIANRELHAFWQGFGYPLLISIVTVGLISCWAAQLEFYPFTAMQMFSKGNTSGIVRYHKVLAHYDSGVIARSYLEKIIPALYDTRYRRTLRRCLSENPKDIQVCEELLTTAGIIYNNKHNTNDKIKQLEVQLWEWDFRKNPSDSQKGSMVQRRFIQVN